MLSGTQLMQTLANLGAVATHQPKSALDLALDGDRMCKYVVCALFVGGVLLLLLERLWYADVPPPPKTGELLNHLQTIAAQRSAEGAWFDDPDVAKAAVTSQAAYVKASKAATTL